MKEGMALQPAFSDELDSNEVFLRDQVRSELPYSSVVAAKPDEMPLIHPEVSGNAEAIIEAAEGSGDKGAFKETFTEAVHDTAVEVTFHTKGKPIEELSVQEANDMTCAICLDQIPVAELCAIKGCDHVYCGKCILAWTVHRDPPSCPQCKAPFSNLLTFRKLDGSMSDYPVEESVCLLKRSHWFEAYLKEVEKGKAVVPPVPESFGAAPFTAEDAREWQEWQDYSQDYNRYDYEFDEDDEVEAYYFSAAAGHKRILGNRRFGENGFISSGRMQARPVAQSSRSAKGKAKASPGASASKQAASPAPAVHTGGSKSVGSASTPRTGGPATPGTPAQTKPGKKQVACETLGSSGSSGGKGRRAHRKEKLASADARACMLASP